MERPKRRSSLCFGQGPTLVGEITTSANRLIRLDRLFPFETTVHNLVAVLVLLYHLMVGTSTASISAEQFRRCLIAAILQLLLRTLERAQHEQQRAMQPAECDESIKRPKRRRNAAKPDGQIVFPTGPKVVVNLLLVVSPGLARAPTRHPSRHSPFVPSLAVD